MIWIHCGDADAIASTRTLALRLADRDRDIDVLVTADMPDLANIGALPENVIVCQVPVDSPTKVRAFLDHHAPAYLIWNGGELRSALLRTVESVGIGATLMNAQVEGIVGGAARWRPGATRTAVRAFHQIMTIDGATATRLRRGGVTPDKVRATGPIREDPSPLPHNANELTVMVEALEARPVWLAANVSPNEVNDIAQAHLTASRKSHRMMLIITPHDIHSGPQIARILRETGLKTGIRSDGDDPTAEMQAYIADLPDELGLWYRIAPLTFVGGTLGGGHVLSPFDPIVLGSAVIHGTFKAPHEERFARLTSVEASREIRSTSELAIAVGTLLSPEQTARMALAGWQEVTRTADITNDLIQMALSYETGERDHP